MGGGLWGRGRGEVSTVVEVYHFSHSDGTGAGGERVAEGIATGRARGMVGLLAPMAESSARPPRKRRIDMDTHTEFESRTRRRVHSIANAAQFRYRHTDFTQSLQDTTSTTGQASLHGGGDGNYTD